MRRGEDDASDRAAATTQQDTGECQSLLQDQWWVAPQQSLPLWRIMLISAGWVGIQMVWSLEYAITTPFFSTNLKAGDTLSNMVWCIGPIAGMIVGPIVGSLSDSSTNRWGRRRPFILAGTILCGVSSLVFANSEKIAGKASTGALVIAILSSAIRDFSINVTMGPLRALSSDLCPDSQQANAQTVASIFQGGGAIIGFFIVTLWDDPLNQMELIFIIAVAALVLFVGISLVFGREIPQRRATRISGCQQAKDSLVVTFKGIARMPWSMIKLVFVQSLSWFALFCLNPQITSWFGNVIYGAAEFPDGSKDYKDRMQKGVNAGSYASMFQSAAQLVYSLVVPWVILLLGLKLSYLASLVPLTVATFVAFFLSNSGSLSYAGASACIALTGITMAGVNIFPFAIVGRLFPETKGLMMGVLNIFIAIPQLIDTLYIGEVIKSTNHSYPMLLTGVYAAAAVVLTLFVDTTPPSSAKGVDPEDKTSQYEDPFRPGPTDLSVNIPG